MGFAEISKERQKKLSDFCKKIGIQFKNLSLLDLAFHHRSFCNENAEFLHKNNERLEFLGDSVLGMATTSFLFEDMKENPEGDLAKIKAAVVSEETLAPIAKKIGVSSLLVLGKGEELSGGREKKAILADAVEAIIGALYLDGGWKIAREFVLSLIVPEIRAVQENRAHKDYKTLLQEWYQKKQKAIPEYRLVGKSGPEHNKTFSVVVRLGEIEFGPERGKSKKEAEQKVARIAFDELTKVP